jgi:hypothetical protein
VINVTGHVEPADVLPRDAAIRTDVNNVDASDLVPESFNRSRDDAPGNERLSKAHFVRDEKASCRWRVVIHLLEHVVDGVALKRLQRT